MAKQPLNDDIRLLRAQYEQSLYNLNKILTAKTTKGNSTAYTRDLIASTKQEISVLNSFTESWARGAIPAAYTGGINEAYKLYRDANVTASLVAVNNKVVMTIIENTTGALTDVNNYIGRRVEDGIRAASLQATADKITQGQTVKQMQQNLKDTLTASGIMEITDKAGRVINVLAYANMVGRTTTREATNRGHIQQVQGIGRDLVKMSTTYTTCPVCAPLEGRVYSISGKDKRYPPLSRAFKKGYATIHPNCTHSALPYIEENDPNFKKTLEDSNRPFEISDKDEDKLKRYYDDQAKKADRRRDLKAYEKLKLEDPDNAPKTFSAFRAKQRAAAAAKEKARKEFIKQQQTGKQAKTISQAKKAAATKNKLTPDAANKIKRVQDAEKKVTNFEKNNIINVADDPEYKKLSLKADTIEKEYQDMMDKNNLWYTQYRDLSAAEKLRFPDRSDFSDWRKTVDINDLQDKMIKHMRELSSIKVDKQNAFDNFMRLDTIKDYKALKQDVTKIKINEFIKSLKVSKTETLNYRDVRVFSDGFVQKSDKYKKMANVHQRDDGIKLYFKDKIDVKKQAIDLDKANKILDKVHPSLKAVIDDVEFTDIQSPSSSFAFASASNNSMTFWRNDKFNKGDDLIEYIYSHEAAHLIDQEIGNFVHGTGYIHFSNVDEIWKDIIDKDYLVSQNFAPTAYGLTNKKEDFAESVALFMTDPGRLITDYPNRYTFLKEIFKP